MIVRAAQVSSEEFLYAATFYNLKLIQRYIRQNKNNPAALNVRNGAGCSALLLAIDRAGDRAAASEGRAIVNELLSAGVNVNTCNDSKTSPLLAAVCSRNLEVLADLLAVEGLNLNPEAYHQTPLHRAASFGETEATKMLLEAGAFIEDLQQFLDTHPDEIKFGAIKKLLMKHNEINKRKYFITQVKLDSCSINQTNTKLLMAMLDHEFSWLREITANLKSKHQLDSVSLSMALHRVAYQLPQTTDAAISSDYSLAVPLSQISQTAVQVAQRQRLEWLISSLTELNALHENFLCHGDLSTNSFGLNIETGKLQLIDGERAHKVPAFSNRKHSFLLQYSVFAGQRFESTESFPQDIFMFGKVIAEKIFPELFGYFNAFENKEKNALVEDAIIKLVAAMTAPSAEKRCTSEQALTLCQLLHDNVENLTKELLHEFLQTTINRRTLTAEDVLRESARPDSFSM